MAILLEVLNKIAIVPALILILAMATYLRCAAMGRSLRNEELSSFIIATMVLVFFLAVRFSATVLWYIIDQHLLPVQMIFLIAILGMIAGLFCMIRAITKPFYGSIPWLVSIALTLAAALVLLL